MSDIIGVRFKSCGKIYDFAIDGLQVRKGDTVVVESEFGLSIGSVVVGPHARESSDRELKKVIRLAAEGDLRQKADNETFAKEAMDFCLERVMARGLPMKLVCSEATLDRKRIVFYFTADGRIDFRELVKDLAAKFKTRIEMRQIGVRDKAKMVGGLGICGKELCCRLFLTSFEPISIKMAKQQELVLNTGKLSGTCGRLMCCLGYEYMEAGTGVAAAGKGVAEAAEGEPVKEEQEETEVALREVPCCAAVAQPAPPQPEQPEQPKEAGEAGERTGRHRKHKKRRRRRKSPHKNE
jgi:cell fate regulator YaaT (PSP1 superfamily)